MSKINEIKELIESGLSPKRVAGLTGMRVEEINNYGFSIKKEPFNEEKIIKMFSLGVSKRQLGVKFKVGELKIIEVLSKKNITRTKSEGCRIFKFNETKMDKIDTAEKAYWLGFLYADAYNGEYSGTLTVALSNIDYGHLDKLSSFFEIENKKIIVLNTFSRFTISSKHLCQSLENNGCMQNKSFKITFPEFIDKQFQLDFIRGYFDGDGSFSYTASNESWKFTIVSTKEMCLRIKDILEELCGVNILMRYISKTNNNTYEIICNGNTQLQRLMPILYNNSNNKIRLDRKYNKYLDFLSFIEKRKQAGLQRVKWKLTVDDKIKVKTAISNNSKISIGELAILTGLSTRSISKIKNQIVNGLI